MITDTEALASNPDDLDLREILAVLLLGTGILRTHGSAIGEEARRTLRRQMNEAGSRLRALAGESILSAPVSAASFL